MSANWYQCFISFGHVYLKNLKMRLAFEDVHCKINTSDFIIYCLVNVQSYWQHKCFGCHVILASIGSWRFHSSGCDTYLRSIIESDKCEIKKEKEKRNCKIFKIMQDSILCNFNVVGGEGGGEGSFGHTPCPKRLPSFWGGLALPVWEGTRRGPFQNKTSQFKKLINTQFFLASKVKV